MVQVVVLGRRHQQLILLVLVAAVAGAVCGSFLHQLWLHRSQLWSAMAVRVWLMPLATLVARRRLLRRLAIKLWGTAALVGNVVQR